MELNIILPSKPKIIAEDEYRGSYEIEGLYPGYGQTLGNSLRRIVLSSIAGTAVTSLKVEGAPHEFSTLPGVKEDVLTMILNLKKIRFKIAGDSSQTATIKAKGVKTVKGTDILTGGQVEVVNPEQVIATLTDKNASLEIEMILEKSIGYIPKETLQQTRSPAIGTIILDAAFAPIRRVSYEVENMRVGDRTDYNRLRFNIETDGTVPPREALEKSIEIMINQLKAIIGFKEEDESIGIGQDIAVAEMGGPAGDADISTAVEQGSGRGESIKAAPKPKDVDFLKTRVEDFGLPARIIRVLMETGIRTIGGLTRKRESDLADISGLGEKGIDEIKKFLRKHDLELKP